ncbi:transposase [Patescibacteria group bacterium]|nr:transposase [Patescibacteria group bacterium]
MRKTNFVSDEYYHIYNRGVDKREIFSDRYDADRFFQSMKEFNVVDPIGSIYENSFADDKKHKLGSSTPKSKLVEFICYCLNSNHYHFLLKQVAEDGIKKFMHKLGTGYTNYFNGKEKRNGSLFQGRFKSIHIDSNEYLLHLSAYVNLNDRVHGLDKLGSSTPKSSWEEYVSMKNFTTEFCSPDIILDQFDSRIEYEKFALEALENIRERKNINDELSDELLLE